MPLEVLGLERLMVYKHKVPDSTGSKGSRCEGPHRAATDHCHRLGHQITHGTPTREDEVGIRPRHIQPLHRFTRRPGHQNLRRNFAAAKAVLGASGRFGIQLRYLYSGNDIVTVVEWRGEEDGRG